MKNLYKFYNQYDIPWVQLIWRTYQYNNSTPHSGTPKGSFWWRDCLSHVEKFKELTSCNIGSGKSICLWNDKWGDEEIAESTYSHLHSFAKDPNINVSKVLNEANIYNLFHLPLSHIAHQELQEPRTELADATTGNLVYSWNFKWSNPIYSTKKSIDN
jgi:hypothetical protein